ncbi:MAG: hypothetical protein IKI71_04275 [Lachnospiraceae bacterium]|nr:hypothetical protein [Lachnospiraceae bacterium]
MALFTITFFAFATFAENVNVSLNYGINKVAKGGNNLPIELSIENRDSQDFRGYLDLNVYENNNSVFVYRIDMEIDARSTKTYYRNISITNLFNAVVINLYNHKEELIVNERTNIDLSFYNEKLIIGVISSDYNSLSYLDNLILTDSSVQTKIVPINVEKVKDNKHYLDSIDMLLISDYDLSDKSYMDDAIYSLLNSGKPLLVGLGKSNRLNSLPSFLRHNYIDSRDAQNTEQRINVESGIAVCIPDSFTDFARQKDADRKFIELLERSVDEYWILKLSNSNNSYLNNDYYNISNLLNIVDKMKLPDVFIISVLLLFYVTFLTIIIYVFLRNINRREQYGKYALIFSIAYTIVMVSFGYSIMKKNTFLTYLSIVNIKDSNTKETAFLNFRTSENGSYSFDTGIDIKLNPVLMNNRQPIISLNFMDAQKIKSTIFTEGSDRKTVTVENAKDFDSNVFIYENSSYLNDIYNLDTSFQRYDSMITGRITNKMSLTIKNAHILMFGKIIKIGDIEPNHSISLSRATSIGAPIGNNLMISDIISDESNRNLVKYYLDENVFGYYDYALLFGFIDNNGTIDINSQDVGDVYGRTLLVTKINRDPSLVLDDYCALENNVENVEGYYDYETNTINGDTEVINEYTFSNFGNISKIYFEGIDSYDHGSLESYVPFYGDIMAYNVNTNSYEAVVNNTIDFNKLSNYLISGNKIIVKFNPLSRDPLYRKTSLPVLRAIAEK